MKTINKLFVLAVSLCSFTACNTDVLPPTGIPTESYWKTENDAIMALSECYRNMPSFSSGMQNELTTDNAHSQKPWEGNFEFVQKSALSPSTGFGSYDFVMVRRVNTILENIDKCDMSTEKKERMKAEARFFRAFTYLELNQQFGKVPIITTTLAYDAPNVPRNSVAEVQKFVLDELAAVATILPDQYSGGTNNENSRVTSGAALALRARAALYFGNYVEAESSARAVMNKGKYSLWRTGALDAAQQLEAKEMDLFIDYAAKGIDKDKFTKGMFNYVTIWTGKGNPSPTNPEYILTREYHADVNTSDYTRYFYLLEITTGDPYGYSSYKPIQDLVDAYWDVNGYEIPSVISVETRKTNYDKFYDRVKDMSDEEYAAFCSSPEIMTFDYMKEFRNRDSRLYVSMTFPGKMWGDSPRGSRHYRWMSNQFSKDGNYSWSGYTYRKMSPTTPYRVTNDDVRSADDFPVIRYAEVLLTFAEARTQNTGYDGEVMAALNDLRDRCGMPNVPSGLSQQQAIDLIRNERRLELMGEGQRFNDIRRYGKEYCAKVMNTATYAPHGSLLIQKVWDDKNILMPIPQNAIDLNPLLKDDQNPGY